MKGILFKVLSCILFISLKCSNSETTQKSSVVTAHITGGRLYEYKNSAKNKTESYIFNDSLDFHVYTIRVELNDLKIELYLKSYVALGMPYSRLK